MTQSNSGPKPLRPRILAYIVSNGEGTADGIARAFNLTPEEVDQGLQSLAAEHEIYLMDSDPDRLSYGLSIRWLGKYLIPGEFVEAARVIPDLTVISFRSHPTGDAGDDRPSGHPVGIMIEVRGILHPRIFADLDRAVVTGVALRHVDRQEADWAARAFFRMIAPGY